MLKACDIHATHLFSLVSLSSPPPLPSPPALLSLALRCDTHARQWVRVSVGSRNSSRAPSGTRYVARSLSVRMVSCIVLSLSSSSLSLWGCIGCPCECVTAREMKDVVRCRLTRVLPRWSWAVVCCFVLCSSFRSGMPVCVCVCVCT